jgi:uncharacterized membrane protein YdjX (TVP38/TMEM64 family)
VNRSILIKGVLALSLVLFLFLSEYVWDIVSLFHPDRIQEILVKAGSVAPFLYMIIMALAVVVSCHWRIGRGGRQLSDRKISRKGGD